MTSRGRLGLLLALVATLLLGGVPQALGATTATSTWSPLPSRWPSAPAASATSYLLVDAETGQVLAERDADARRPVASTIKMLLALVVVDQVPLDEVVRVGDEVLVGGAGVGLRPGDRWTVAELLDATIARSGNDAARALAVHVGGSLEGAVALMRERAGVIGIGAATIADPTGLDDTNRLSARELGVVARAYLDEPQLRRIAAHADVLLPSGREHTRNLLLDRYPDANGIKTGYTDASGWCLVGSAEVDGRELVAVVLGARTDDARFDEAAALLDHGFTRFAAAPLHDELRLRRAGGWVALPPAVSHVWAPSQDLATTVELPVDLDTPSTVVVRWGDGVVARFERPAAPAGSTSPGARLTDALYRALRHAHRADLWPDRDGAVG